MRLADLLLSTAYDGSGDEIGQVHDVRLRHSMTPDGRHRLQIVGVSVGAGAIGARTGYVNGAVEGPAVVRRLMRWASRHAKYIGWNELRWDPDERRVDTERHAGDLPHPEDATPDG
ncbi:MAG TPA: hypothetical protein VM345_14490 [Acidimicrobiales bacterium]|jgi:hypothetical protein|nr:hypothetical protein [Acidimicrobiales bacterium]